MRIYFAIISAVALAGLLFPVVSVAEQKKVDKWSGCTSMKCCTDKATDCLSFCAAEDPETAEYRNCVDACDAARSLCRRVFASQGPLQPVIRNGQIISPSIKPLQ